VRIDWTKYSVRLISVGRAAWRAGVVVDPSYNKDIPVTDFGVNLFPAGRGSVTTHRGRERLGPGMILWRRPGQVYDLRQDPENPLYNIFLHFELRDSEGKLRPWEDPLPPEVLHPPDPKLADAVLSRVVELIYGGQQGYAWAPPAGEVRAVATALFTGVLMDLDRDADRPQMRHPHKGSRGRAKPLFGAAQRRYDLFQQLTSRLIESPQKLPTVAELAEQAGYSRAHFSRAFKHDTIRSPQAFMIELRVNRAQEMLRSTTQTVTQIAEALGYPDIFHFSKQFKQRTGRTPTEFRSRAPRHR
jgi:AraC-like DNA-binding protein